MTTRSKTITINQAQVWLVGMGDVWLVGVGLVDSFADVWLVPCKEVGLVGIGLVDSFGDLVPPRSLDAERDGMMGWYKREGEGTPMCDIVHFMCRMSSCLSIMASNYGSITSWFWFHIGMAYISNVAVLPSARVRGIARRLLEEAHCLAESWGCR